MQKVTFVILTITQTLFGQGTGKPTTLTNNQQRANLELKRLVDNHPDQNMRTQFNSWVANKVLYFSYQSDLMTSEMHVELVLINSKLVLVLVINPNFLNGSTGFKKIEDDKYKQLVIFHEYIHIANHLSGKTTIQSKKFSKENAVERAINLWGSEWFAVKAEWDLAKKMGVRHLMPTINTNVSRQGENLGFLNGFYEMLKNGKMTSQEGLKLLHPIWDKIYLQEKEKINKSTKK